MGIVQNSDDPPTKGCMDTKCLDALNWCDAKSFEVKIYFQQIKTKKLLTDKKNLQKNISDASLQPPNPINTYPHFTLMN